MIAKQAARAREAQKRPLLLSSRVNRGECPSRNQPRPAPSSAAEWQPEPAHIPFPAEQPEQERGGFASMWNPWHHLDEAILRCIEHSHLPTTSGTLPSRSGSSTRGQNRAAALTLLAPSTLRRSEPRLSIPRSAFAYRLSHRSLTHTHTLGQRSMMSSAKCARRRLRSRGQLAFRQIRSFTPAACFLAW